jgi:hypothetical protein
MILGTTPGETGLPSHRRHRHLPHDEAHCHREENRQGLQHLAPYPSPGTRVVAPRSAIEVPVPRDAEIGCRRADYIVDVRRHRRSPHADHSGHHPSDVCKGSHKDGINTYLPADVEILTATIDDAVVGDAVHRPNAHPMAEKTEKAMKCCPIAYDRAQSSHQQLINLSLEFIFVYICY